MKKVDVIPVMEQTMKQIEKGAFLTVKAGDRLNTMTIGWGTMGICWRKPIFMVAVRNSRHTFSIIEEAQDFTVSLPNVRMQDELFYCGTKSGRDVDKFTECDLKTAPGQMVKSPIIDIPGLHFECLIVYKNALDPVHLISGYHDLYPQKDYHTLYFGEIVASYQL